MFCFIRRKYSCLQVLCFWTANCQNLRQQRPDSNVWTTSFTLYWHSFDPLKLLRLKIIYTAAEQDFSLKNAMNSMNCYAAMNSMQHAFHKLSYTVYC